MGKITYKLTPFNAKQAESGALVVMINKNYNGTSNTGSDIQQSTSGNHSPSEDIPTINGESVGESSGENSGGISEESVTSGGNHSTGNPTVNNRMIISNITLNDNTWNKSEYFFGAGVCRLDRGNYVLTVDSVDYHFTYLGLGYDNAIDFKLMMGTVEDTQSSTGNIATSTITTTRSINKNNPPSYSYVDTSGKVAIDNLTPKDLFAMQALRGMFDHMNDPSSVSTAVKAQLCDTAYQWAEQMMVAAANARITNTTGETTNLSNVDVTALKDNTEKLLNNIVGAIDKTIDKTTTPKNGNNSIKYYKRIGFPELIEKIENYVKHNTTETEPSTKTTVGLDDLITAIKNINVLGGLGGSVTVDTSSLVSAINNPRNISGTVNIGNTGIGSSSSNPIHISGGAFPSKAAVSASNITDANLDSILSFNGLGAVGYITKDNLKKAILGYLYTYASIAALSTAVLDNIADNTIYNKISSLIVNEIKNQVGHNNYCVTINGQSGYVTPVNS